MTDGDDPNQAGERAADHAELVHETRKAIKRMRAFARLLREELGEQEFKRVNGSLRAAGRRLGGARDTQVRLATLERLIDRHPKALGLGGIDGLRRQLAREREHRSTPRQELLEDLVTMRYELSGWNLMDLDFPALAPGLQRIYGEGRRHHDRVSGEQASNAEDVHDWRKRVKSLYYALDILGAGKSKGAMRRTTRRAARLGELLGEEHDLWMLAGYVEERPGALGEDSAARKSLLKLIERRRKRLRKRALALGIDLYELPPGDFIQRVSDSLSP